jgi:DNA topoisomerase I
VNTRVSTDAIAPPGLVYVTDNAPGIRRLRRGKGFSYLRPDGTCLRDAQQLKRIRSLAIPPAYTDVWICPLPHGHLQATGRDARGRKQYRYHAEWRSARDADKFERMAEFGMALPRIRTRVKKDLEAPVDQHMGREAVLAALVRLLDTTFVRVGNDEYARTNGSFGLTTLRNQHAAVKGSTLRLRFRGKSGVSHQVTLDDPRVARIVRLCQTMPGQELFQYEDGTGETRCVGSADVNSYLREASGADFTAKDFRTWHASVLALDLLCQLPEEAVLNAHQINEVVADVAKRLGNTIAVCKKSYVHPGILLAAAQGSLMPFRQAPRKCAGLTAAECRLLAFLSACR